MDLWIAIAAFLLNLGVVIIGILMTYFKSERSTAVRLAVHEQEIASLFKILNSLTGKIEIFIKELHEMHLELAGKTVITTTRRKYERRKPVNERKSKAA